MSQNLRDSLWATWQLIRGPIKGWRWSAIRPYWLWLFEPNRRRGK